MEKGTVQVYYGDGQGKSSAALGNAIRTAGRGGAVVIIQFLKCPENQELLSRLEPEVKIFRFERSEAGFDEMTDAEKQEQKQNIVNGLNFAKKVLTTDECDLLILDEVFGVLAEGMADVQEVIHILNLRSVFTSVILTGRTLPKEIEDIADSIVRLDSVKG